LSAFFGWATIMFLNKLSELQAVILR
jgi:hypothetical protein